ncbi:hypothetical protein [Flavobacterium sp. WC2430]|uniref:hypothetical protein n=1 Tax=Flavobacterium sp. WC2430 TaxID=3234137 RepID=UPI003466A6D9
MAVQLSVAVAVPVFEGLIDVPHVIVKFAGQVIDGSCVSLYTKTTSSVKSFIFGVVPVTVAGPV